MRGISIYLLLMLQVTFSCMEGSKKDVSLTQNTNEVIHQKIIIDEKADSIYYHGQWYFLDDYNLDWVSLSGDHIKWHINEPQGIVYYNKPILNEHGDTVAYEGADSPARIDDYGDTIIYKHNDVYF